MKDAKLYTTKNQPIFLTRTFHFLEEIKIDYYLSDENFDSFLQGVKIQNGTLIINTKNILCVGDILHEAGHLACIPSTLRVKANDNIKDSLGEEYTFEMAVIVWSVAAAAYLEIPLTEIFHQEGYNGDANWLLEQYTAKNYIGLPLLQWMGLAVMEDKTVDGINLPFKMLRWTRA